MILEQKSDTLGALASSLCLIHCLATPLIFIGHTTSVHQCHAAPVWWRAIDFIFLAISFIAVYNSSKHTTKKWIRYAFWFCWGLLAIVIFMERLEWVHIPEPVLYILAFSLSCLHIYNRKYCQCSEDTCCVNT